MSIFEDYWQRIAGQNSDFGIRTAAEVSEGPCELCSTIHGQTVPCQKRSQEAREEELTCEDCGMLIDADKLEDCDDCDGTGWFPPERKAEMDYTGHCDGCSGTGKEIMFGGKARACDHHGFDRCRPCNAIRSYLREQNESDRWPSVAQFHVRSHGLPDSFGGETQQFYTGPIFGSDSDR